MARKQTTDPNLTRSQRRRLARKEYREALKEFTSFHPDNETRDRRRAANRLEQADRNLRRWRW